MSNLYKLENNGNPSNILFKNCKIPNFFQHYNTLELNRKIQTDKEYKINILNPKQYDNKIAKGFDKITNIPTYTSLDPRLYSVVYSEHLQLDKPPIDGKVKLKDIYNKNIDEYKLSTREYQDLNDGQISYYTDESISQPFYKPIFSENAYQITNVYKDPMDSIKPEYNRELIDLENPILRTKNKYKHNLSFLEDTQNQREDIISLQQRKYNQTKWCEYNI